MASGIFNLRRYAIKWLARCLFMLASLSLAGCYAPVLRVEDVKVANQATTGRSYPASLQHNIRVASVMGVESMFWNEQDAKNATVEAALSKSLQLAGIGNDDASARFRLYAVAQGTFTSQVHEVRNCRKKVQFSYTLVDTQTNQTVLQQSFTTDRYCPSCYPPSTSECLNRARSAALSANIDQLFARLVSLELPEPVNRQAVATSYPYMDYMAAGGAELIISPTGYKSNCRQYLEPKLLAVDGFSAPIPAYFTRVKLTPGKHQGSFEVTWSNGQVESREFALDMVANRKYRLLTYELEPGQDPKTAIARPKSSSEKASEKASDNGLGSSIFGGLNIITLGIIIPALTVEAVSGWTKTTPEQNATTSPDSSPEPSSSPSPESNKPEGSIPFPGCCFVWIVDEESGEIVGGTPPEGSTFPPSQNGAVENPNQENSGVVPDKKNDR